MTLGDIVFGPFLLVANFIGNLVAALFSVLKYTFFNPFIFYALALTAMGVFMIFKVANALGVQLPNYLTSLVF